MTDKDKSLHDLFEVPDFKEMAKRMMLEAENIIFMIIDDDYRIKWVNDYGLRAAGNTMDSVFGSFYPDWYEGNDRQTVVRQLERAAETGDGGTVIVKPAGDSPKHIYVRKRIYKIPGGYFNISFDHTVVIEAEEKTENIVTAFKVISDVQDRIVHDAQIKLLDAFDVHCRAACDRFGNRKPEHCVAMNLIRKEVEEGKPYLQAALTTTEKAVAKLYRAGYLRKQVAEKLGISENTVKNHSTSIRKKLKIQQRSIRLVDYLQRFRI